MSSHSRNKPKLLARLRRIEGQVHAIIRMMEEDRPCPETLLQIAATRAALGKVGTMHFQDHLESCVVEAIEEGKGPEAIDEIMDVMNKFVK